MDLTAIDKTRFAVEIALERKGLDIKVLEIGKVSLIADYFIIVSGTSKRHVQGLADHILDELKEEKDVTPLNRTGYDGGTWVLLDYGDLVVHIFQEEERNFYNLERLWGHAPKVDNI